MDEKPTLTRYLAYLTTPLVVVAVVPLAVVLAAILYLVSIVTGLIRLGEYFLSKALRRKALAPRQGPHFRDARVQTPPSASTSH